MLVLACALHFFIEILSELCGMTCVSYWSNVHLSLKRFVEVGDTASNMSFAQLMCKEFFISGLF